MAINLDEAKKLALENYSTWGQWVVECFEDSELREELDDFDTMEEWVEIRIGVADANEEIENSSW
jgi:hypothetical protein